MPTHDSFCSANLECSGWRRYPPGRGQVAVWAGTAQQVQVRVGEDVIPMRREGDWWVCERHLPDGVDYRFVVDEVEVPDPRALMRPTGVHGPSRTWTPPVRQLPNMGSALGKVFYELHVGTFTPEGTFAAAREKLPLLQQLGVEVVEVMPVAAFPGAFGWGYDGVGIYATAQCYGGPAEFIEFVDCAHDLGMQVCLDLVLNHLGPVGNYLAPLGQYYSANHSTPWGPAFDLDGPHALHTRDFLLGAALFFLAEMGCDALRLDAVHALVDDSPYHFLAELSDTVAQLEVASGRTLTLIAESDLNDARMVTPTAVGGLGMDGQWDDDLHHALHAAFTGEDHGYYADFANRQALVKTFSQVFLHDGCYSSFRRRNWGAPVGEDVGRTRFIIFSQNHDQVGNRALGDRPSQCLSDAQLAAQSALVLLSPFTPLLFQGQEWGTRTPFLFFSDQEGDAAMAQAMREGRRREFADHGWDHIYGHAVVVPDPTSASSVQASRLDWSELDQVRSRDLWRFHQQAIAVRRKYPQFTSGVAVRAQWVGDVFTLTWPGDTDDERNHRSSESDGGTASLVVAVNFGSPQPLPSAPEILLSWPPQQVADGVLDTWGTVVMVTSSVSC